MIRNALDFFFKAGRVYFGNSSPTALCTAAFSWKHWNYIKSAFGCHLLFLFSFILFPKLGRCCIKYPSTVWQRFPCGAPSKLERKTGSDGRIWISLAFCARPIEAWAAAPTHTALSFGGSIPLPLHGAAWAPSMAHRAVGFPCWNVPLVLGPHIGKVHCERRASACKGGGNPPLPFLFSPNCPCVVWRWLLWVCKIELYVTFLSYKK